MSLHSSKTANAENENLAKQHYENFPVGSFLIPKEKRPHIWNLYAFARAADDFADEGYPSRFSFSSMDEWRQTIEEGQKQRLDKLDFWEDQLKRCYESSPTHPTFISLEKTIDTLQIPDSLFLDLLKAFRMDVLQRRHQSFENLLFYCKHSANPVGRLVLWVFGHHDPSWLEESDAICTGLQLANFWQDIGVDLEKDRIYIPNELLMRHHISEADLFNQRLRSPELLMDLWKETLPFFEKGKALPKKVPGRLSLELKCTWHGGVTILKRACLNPLRFLSDRPKISLSDKFLILAKSLFAYPTHLDMKIAGVKDGF
ncbi:MAG: squalene synthase HpnC [Deltaproteobacteria bacterium]|nr:squalene synthase HpnC [Deltaproteobacteria bacterium]